MSKVSRPGTQEVPVCPPAAPRLRETLSLLLAGLDKHEIARAMGLSDHTVHDYIRAVYKHYGVKTRAKLMAMWIRRDH